MRGLLALCLFTLLLVQETSCSIQQEKQIEFQEKLQKFTASCHSCEMHKTSNKTRVFYPIDYGADPTGKRDSSDAILKALEDAFRVPTELELLPGINDLGGVVIDLQGGNYKISQPIRFSPGGGNVLVQAGTLRASAEFPTDRYLVELWSPDSKVIPNKESINQFPPEKKDDKKKNVGIYYEDITFRDILFDSSYLGEGMLVIDSARIRIHNCFFIHFTTEGILVQKGHETFITSCFLGQHLTVGGDPKEKNYTGTAIDLASNDNAVTDVAIFFFLGDANIVLKAVGGTISGVTIVDNMFKSDANYMNPIVQLDGNFTNIDQVVIDNNNAIGMTVKSTVGKLRVGGDGRKWVANFSSILVFPDQINHFQYSFSFQGLPVAFPAHGVTSVSNNVVVVESDKTVNGVVSVAVDQYNRKGETFK